MPAAERVAKGVYPDTVPVALGSLVGARGKYFDMDALVSDKCISESSDKDSADACFHHGERSADQQDFHCRPCSDSCAEIMELARTGDRITVELTAHDAINGARHQTDVSVNLISTEVGLILVSPPSGEPRDGGNSIFAPGEPFAISMAVRDLTDRLPSGTWFPNENYDI